MSKQGPGKQVLWIRLSSIKKLFIGLCLAVLFIAVATMNIPAVKTAGHWGLPLSGKVIVLDAGHGGPDGGAVSKQGVIEKDVNLSIALYLRDYLQQAGAVVYMTREGDYDLAGADTKGYSRRKTEDLKQRAKMIENSKADLFLSIHLNSFPGRWSGAQTFYYPNHPDNKTLAVLIQEEIKRNLENTDRVAKTVNHVYLLKTVTMPAALVEVGFLSHPEEAQMLRDEGYQRKMAASVYKGMLRYLSGEKVNLSAEM
ncbi:MULTISPECIES: N-acetylmuramoyl-L-alanine amidase CwlD [Paenibacillus]|uniref:Germination-specific N-acetylmuramoyl-L-alanine amidase n=1 Tax=Paenibacillus albilobatus TaxID=2716884 RepID=A0A920CCU3_9BACL|nr:MULTISPECIES: N-acetylmuramoyl-L-alanine amidase CwlD [Paenibacillus]MDR9857534.1 N-acetylmuramoyl-L-alanine amidase CwlD [Paenibacillus sp. VCA1]GIO34915.1 germination-specific N-acetylmuramoyl-L-alanine amidase [Paenibacillus albilobatus]